MLGTQTRGGRMEGADKSTELWRHPKCKVFVNVIKRETYSRVDSFYNHLSTKKVAKVRKRQKALFTLVTGCSNCRRGLGHCK